MFERPRERLLFCIHTVANRATLHDDDRVMPIFALRRRGQTSDVTRLHLPKHLLKAHGRKMVAFVHKNVPVVGDQVVNDLFPIQTLNDSNVDDSTGTSPATANLANCFDGQIQKCSKSFAPLIEKLASMHEHQGVNFARCNKPRGHDCFPKSSCGAQNTFVVRKHGLGCNLLIRSKLAVKRRFNWLADEPLVILFQGNLVRFEQHLDFTKAAARQSNMPGKFFRASNDAWFAKSG